MDRYAGCAPDSKSERTPHVKTRTAKAFSGVAAIAAIALSLPLAVTAYADDPAPTPAPAAVVANPEGPGCDAYKQQVPTGPGSLASTANESNSAALANNPMLKTFYAAMSGQLNPEVNLVSVLDNGPYIVFAPVDDAFAKLSPDQLAALKADKAALTSLLFYHLALGILGPQDIHGTLTTQQGEQVTVKGKGGDITVDGAKVVCGGIQASNARIYMIDTVLDPASAGLSTSTATTGATPSSTTAGATTAPPTA